MRGGTRLIPLAVAVLVVAAACTEPSAAETSASRSCAVEADHSGEGLLQVLDVWPQTTSTFEGFFVVEFDRQACATAGPAAAAGPDCRRPFPWVSDDPVETSAVLGTSGVERMISGIIRGHHEVPEEEVIYPQEIRETVMVLATSEAPDQHLVADNARTCGSTVAGRDVPVFRVALESQTIDDEIVGMLAVTSRMLIWLEFDEVGWEESDYLPVVDRAIAAAAGAL